MHRVASELPETGIIEPVDHFAAGTGQRHSAPGPQASTWQSQIVEQCQPAEFIALSPEQAWFQKFVAKSGYSFFAGRLLSREATIAELGMGDGWRYHLEQESSMMIWLDSIQPSGIESCPLFWSPFWSPCTQ